MSKRTCSIQICDHDGVINIELSGIFSRKNKAYIDANLSAALDSESQNIILDMRGVEMMTGRCFAVFYRYLSRVYHDHKVEIICESGSYFRFMLCHLGFEEWFSISADKQGSEQDDANASDLDAA